MPSPAKNTTATVIPSLLYADCPAAIEWLCNTFGFEKRAVYPGEGNTIAHAELTFGNGMIMLGSAKEEGFGTFVTPPAKLNNANTQSAYLIVSDSDALHARVVEAGAEIVRALMTTDYGSRDFACRDPEGHIWNFGTYDPWAAAQVG